MTTCYCGLTSGSKVIAPSGQAVTHFPALVAIFSSHRIGVHPSVYFGVSGISVSIRTNETNW
jgi:hypothetical protein